MPKVIGIEAAGSWITNSPRSCRPPCASSANACALHDSRTASTLAGPHRQHRAPQERGDHVGGPAVDCITTVGLIPCRTPRNGLAGSGEAGRQNPRSTKGQTLHPFPMPQTCDTADKRWLALTTKTRLTRNQRRVMHAQSWLASGKLEWRPSSTSLAQPNKSRHQHVPQPSRWSCSRRRKVHRAPGRNATPVAKRPPLRA